MSERCPKCGSFLTQSTIIKQFAPGSVAEKSQLRQGDKIVEINNLPIYSNADIKEYVSSGKGLVTVRVERKGDEQTFLVPDRAGLFTEQIKYLDICENCQKKAKPKMKTTTKAIIIIAVSVAALIAALIFMLVNSKKVNDTNASSDEIDLVSHLTNESLTEKSAEMPLEERIRQILMESNHYTSEILRTSFALPTTPLFEVAYRGTYDFRAMCTVNEKIDIFNSIILGYDFDSLEKERVEIIARLRSVDIGKLYFDYGEWLSPSDKYKGRGSVTLEKTVYDDMRFCEVAASLAYILAMIPVDYYDKAVFIVDGHTDSVSPHDFNQVLSEKRATYVKSILVDMYNIPENRIVTKGFSWDKRVVEKEVSPKDFALNRRAEIKVCFFE